MEDNTIIKTGASIKNDALLLFKEHGISTRSMIDLGNLAKRVDPQRWVEFGVNPLGLVRLTEAYEQHTLPKSRSVSCSDWEQPLRPLQLECKHLTLKSTTMRRLFLSQMLQMTFTQASRCSEDWPPEQLTYPTLQALQNASFILKTGVSYDAALFHHLRL